VLGLVRAFCKAGILTEAGTAQALQDTSAGTPQGGILSPLLANIALSGVGRALRRHPGRDGDSSARHRSRRRELATYRLVRYADDFVVMVNGTGAHVEALREELAEVLAPLGRRLSAAKTRTVHIEEGFDFLGFPSSASPNEAPGARPFTPTRRRRRWPRSRAR
jgi:RNA-directed DNA polymerase